MSNDPLWIEHMHMKKGALHKQMGIPTGQKIAPSKLNKASHAGGKEGMRARLAKRLASFHK